MVNIVRYRGELFKPGNIYEVERLLEFLNIPYRFNYNRRDVFKSLKDLVSSKGQAGIVFLIDELSEFLRSKSDARQFNEDIRFLQFLGEWCFGEPAWVAATLQEELEKTGETTPDAFNKIKDRYPVRFRLSGTHIKELVGRRLVQLKSGAENKLDEVYNFYSRIF